MGRFVQVLVVDDDVQMRRVLRASLATHGFQVRAANDGTSALEVMKNWTPDVVITDLVMPNMNGIDLCRRLRTQSQVPIIVLSVKGEENIKLEAFDAGADDYVTKPFSSGELMARLKVALRRAAIVDDSTPVIETGHFRIDLAQHRAYVRGVEVHLTPKEFDLLAFFAKRPARLVTRQALLAAIWGPDSVAQSEYLRVLIGQLRKKIEPDGAAPQYILTEPWIGYRFDPGS